MGRCGDSGGDAAQAGGEAKNKYTALFSSRESGTG